MSKSLKKLIDINGLREFKNNLVGPDAAYVQTGVIIPFAGKSVPTGYLLCNGAAVGRATYPELFAAIGTTYGSGDGSTTFNLPNLIDKFAQGSAVAGTVKNAGLPNITGSLDLNQNQIDRSHGAFSMTKGIAYVHVSNTGDGGVRKILFDAHNSNPIYGASDTVQPPAITLLPCIKY